MDSSFVIALYNTKDKHHTRASRFLNAHPEHQYLLPEVVLPEATFMLERVGGRTSADNFLADLIRIGANLQSLSQTDLERVHVIRATYADSRFDFVDCCIMALAERLNIIRICTFDRRDFSIFRPAHTKHLELLPD
jgi:hypothetical protein